MKLLLADDHALFRDALVQYLRRSKLQAEIALAKNFYEALDAMHEDSDRDLILLDLRMPGMNGLEGFYKMREEFPHTPIALMSGTAKYTDVRASIEAGAVGYFPKTLSGDELLHGIHSVLSGEMFVPTTKNGHIMPAYYDGHHAYGTKDRADAFKLTRRENEVLEYLAEGASNKEIAQALGLQIVTVKLHVRGICTKLEAKNRTQAAIYAREQGLVQSAAQ